MTMYVLLAAGLLLYGAGSAGGFFIGRKTAQRPPSEPVVPTYDRFLYEHDGIFLAGQNVRFLAESPATYGCPRCGDFHQVTHRQYTYKESGIVGVMYHPCSRAAELDPKTDEIEVQKIGGAA